MGVEVADGCMQSGTESSILVGEVPIEFAAMLSLLCTHICRQLSLQLHTVLLGKCSAHYHEGGQSAAAVTTAH